MTTICCRDTASREHFLKVSFSNDYPQSAPECVADIPEEFTFRWVPTSCISDVLSRFREVAISLDALFRFLTFVPIPHRSGIR